MVLMTTMCPAESVDTTGFGSCVPSRLRYALRSRSSFASPWASPPVVRNGCAFPLAWQFLHWAAPFVSKGSHVRRKQVAQPFGKVGLMEWQSHYCLHGCND